MFFLYIYCLDFLYNVCMRWECCLCQYRLFLKILQMVPLLNISLDGVGFSLHGREDHVNSTISFSFAARSYNDKYDSWEPLVEPVDGFIR